MTLGQPMPDLRAAKDRRYRIKTGAKTATKVQEQEWLEFFGRLAEDPSILLPRWEGKGASPFVRLEARLAKVRRIHAAGGSLRWAARRKDISGAYATTLKILDAKTIPSFAMLKLPDRSVRFVPRGRSRRHHLVAVQNAEEPDLLMLGYLEFARKGKAAFWAMPDAVVATPASAPPPDGFAEHLLSAVEILVSSTPESIACAHVKEGAWHVHALVDGVSTPFDLCGACLDKIQGRIERWILQGHLGRSRSPEAELHVAGSPYSAANDMTRRELETEVERADEVTQEQAKAYVDYSNREYLDWGEQNLKESIEKRKEGYLLVGRDLWLADFEAAAKRFAVEPAEQRLLEAAIAVVPPRAETNEPTLAKIVGASWSEHAGKILRRMAGEGADDERLSEWAKREPAEAARLVARWEASRERLKAFPTYAPESVDARLRPVLRAAEAWHAGDRSEFSNQVQAGSQEAATRVAALALARAGGIATGVEWRYSPEERQAAEFLVPYTRMVLESNATSYDEAVAEVARALDVPKPRRKG